MYLVTKCFSQPLFLRFKLLNGVTLPIAGRFTPAILAKIMSDACTVYALKMVMDGTTTQFCY